MTIQQLKQLDLPDAPGVYQFLDAKKHILYIGKATSLRDRVRSYFSNDVLHTRGKHILDMVTNAATVHVITTDSALEALILESSLIKKHLPQANTKEKDNKSYNYVVITKEEYPHVLVIRERTMLTGKVESDLEYRAMFGPYTNGRSLREALKIIRKIFPYSDSCHVGQARPCFNYQLGLCPGICAGAITASAYNKQIRHIMLFLSGKKSAVIKRLERDMHSAAKRQEFEEAGRIKRMLFSLEHINDVTLLDENVVDSSREASKLRAYPFRIEAFDVAHISGTHTVGVMAALHDGVAAKGEYRKFKIRQEKGGSDVDSLRELLIRRFAHKEWQYPDIVVLDGGTAQRKVGSQVLKEMRVDIPLLSVVKDEKHKAKAILGDKKLSLAHKQAILRANLESHRFAVQYHRRLREKL